MLSHDDTKEHESVYKSNTWQNCRILSRSQSSHASQNVSGYCVVKAYKRPLHVYAHSKGSTLALIGPDLWYITGKLHGRGPQTEWCQEPDLVAAQQQGCLL